MFKLSTKSLGVAAAFLATSVISFSTNAQSGNLEKEYPELFRLYNAFDVAQAELFDLMAEINGDPTTDQAQDQLAIQLKQMANWTISDMIEAGLNYGDAQLIMASPYAALETEARIELARHVGAEHTLADAAAAFSRSSALPVRAAEVIGRGRAFEREIYDIYADKSNSIQQKRSLVEEALASYLSIPDLAVSSNPKRVALYLNGPYANGLKAAFPKFSGLMWSNQWLQLAALEAIVLGQVDPQFADEIDVTLERYRNKLGSETGMTMFPAPTEMPTVPAIAPSLFSQAPEAAVIMDNLNMLEVAVADILAYPKLQGRETAVNDIVAEYTSDDSRIAEIEEYLLSALRGGIFNQGGPAIGALGQSERNRSRIGMDMQNSLKMSTPNH
ncbi:MAG: hypothetical protein AB8B95_15085 [Pseudohongiellaceae bacterium]